jgi:hypothetical protein
MKLTEKSERFLSGSGVQMRFRCTPCLILLVDVNALQKYNCATSMKSNWCCSRLIYPSLCVEVFLESHPKVIPLASPPALNSK